MTELSAHAILYTPESVPYAGVIQIIHGMAEHQGRYRELAQFFTEQGYVVLTSDLRGHGNNIRRDVELGYFGDHALPRLISDIHDNTSYIRSHFPGIPYILLGHGIGALLAVAYTKKYDSFLDGLFLSGMPADRLWPRHAMSLALVLLMVLRGEYHRSKLLNYLIMGQYYRPMVRDGSEFSWLSADQENVKRYEEDPKCGYIYTFNGFKTILDMMDQTYSRGSWICKKPDLPIRLFWGAKDPCMNDANDLAKTVHLFSDHGYLNVAYITYPGQRHEIFRDYDKETVCEDALKELNAIRRAKGNEAPAPSKKSRHIVLDNFVDPEVDKPLVKDEKLDLDKFVHDHEEASQSKGRKTRPKVEMIDFAQIGDTLEDVRTADDTTDSDGTFYVMDDYDDVFRRSSHEDASELSDAAVPSEDSEKPAAGSELNGSSDVSSITSVEEAEQADDNLAAKYEDPSDTEDFDLLIEQLLNNETYVPGSRGPLDDFDGFKIDPENMDGIH